MAETHYATGDDNDLPRTVRAQKEARLRDQLAREAQNAARAVQGRDAAIRDAKAAAQRVQYAPGQAQLMRLQSDGGRAQGYSDGTHSSGYMDDSLTEALPPDYVAPAVVTRFKVPFFHLMFFFLKCVIAAIPALLLAGAIIYAIGQAAQTYFPSLIKMKVLITFP